MLLKMKTYLVLFLFITSTARGTKKLRRPALEKPNFIVLFMDDLGYGDTGFNGHPTTKTPNIDKLAYHGKVLTTWYSGCSICTGSRAALMTGRQFTRTGVPGVFGPSTQYGLNLNETTVAEQLKAGAGYATAIVGKWHLGQRPVYLPGNQGFDYYLGIPYSDDMGNASKVSCSSEPIPITPSETTGDSSSPWARDQYEQAGWLYNGGKNDDPNIRNTRDMDDGDASWNLPLVYQEHNQTKIVEQPLDFTYLAEKYSDFATDFITHHQDEPFFLYVPFSHVHAAAITQPEYQYAGCDFKNATRRGPFGDALAESDWIIGNIMKTLQDLDLEENTLILFASDNGPWLGRDLSGGSMGLLTGRFSGYWNTGKGSTWEGGIRSPAFAYWKGTITPYSRTSEIISSLDLFPTLSNLAGVELPTDRVIDGRDMTDILLKEEGTSKHDFLFFYGNCDPSSPRSDFITIAAVRHGKYKAHFCTGPGIGSETNSGKTPPPPFVAYSPYPLLFNIEKDPSESLPISTGDMPENADDAAAMERIMTAYAFESATFTFGNMVTEPDGPGEGPDRYGLCCDRSRHCHCVDDDSGGVFQNKEQEQGPIGILNIGTKRHHDKYHDLLGEKAPSPPTLVQALLDQMA